MGNSNLTGIWYFYWLNLATLLGSQVCAQHSSCLLQVRPCTQTESAVLSFLAGCRNSPKEGSDPQPRPPESLPRMSVSDFEKNETLFSLVAQGCGDVSLALFMAIVPTSPRLKTGLTGQLLLYFQELSTQLSSNFPFLPKPEEANPSWS